MAAHSQFLGGLEMRVWSLVLLAALQISMFGGQPVLARATVSYSEHAPGTVVVKTGQRRLYYVLGGGIVYPVGVGRAGRTWSGTSFISGKRLRPDWAPPPELRRNRTATVIPGGSPANPMGAAALTLGSGEYAIHGTNAPGSIGGFVSYGCIRMHNSDILDLFGRVSLGTPVVVLK